MIGSIVGWFTGGGLTTIWNNLKWVLLALIIIALPISGYEYRDMKAKKETAELQEKYYADIIQKDHEKDVIAQDFERLKQENQKLKLDQGKKIDNEIKASIYNECILPSSGVQLLNDYIRQVNKTN